MGWGNLAGGILDLGILAMVSCRWLFSPYDFCHGYFVTFVILVIGTLGLGILAFFGRGYFGLRDCVLGLLGSGFLKQWVFLLWVFWDIGYLCPGCSGTSVILAVGRLDIGFWLRVFSDIGCFGLGCSRDDILSFGISGL